MKHFSEYTSKEKKRASLTLGLIIFSLIVFSSSGQNLDPIDVEENNIQIQTKYSTEDKQSDFKNFYIDFHTQGQRITDLQIKLVEIGNLVDNDAELYSAYESIKNQQKDLASKSMDISVPKSLKEYSQLRLALVDLTSASNKFKSAIDSTQEFINSGDLKQYQKAVNYSDTGLEKLKSSMNKVEEVADELEVDVSDPSKISVSSGSKEKEAGGEVFFELVENMATLTGSTGHNKTIVIDSKHLNEKDLNTLGNELKKYAESDTFSFINVFSNMSAAKEIRSKYTNDDPSLSQSEEQLYEKSFIGKYIKSGDIHNFTYCLAGYYLDDCKNINQQRIVNF